MTKQLDESLSSYGLDPDDFPVPLRISSALIRYAENLPRDMRAGYQDALREFFWVYQRLDEVSRARILKQVESSLHEECDRKRSHH